MPQCLGAIDCTHTSSKQTFTNFTDQIKKKKERLNGHVIQVLRRAVQLEIAAATELKPCTWTRIVIVLRLHLKFKMQQCRCSLRLRYLAINTDTNKINETFYQDILSDSLCSTMTVVHLIRMTRIAEL